MGKIKRIPSKPLKYNCWNKYFTSYVSYYYLNVSYVTIIQKLTLNTIHVLIKKKIKQNQQRIKKKTRSMGVVNKEDCKNN